ncbi:PaaI family thioesterase [Sphingomonas sp. 35-24ZXX]|uniref:PaaI family thioesterase n=1 Tax=Sphingomonas sp. 35-24ZXX TaxID=1545915 RepID=UPI001E32B738|nr:PaaI family thioesterase [Sphingomonas sp. 35-24ZXX]
MDAQTLQLPDDFAFGPDPDRPGWMRWALREDNRYNSTLGPMWVMKRADGTVVVRTEPGHLQGNLANNVHGGAILTQVDIALFVCARLNGSLRHGPAVTLELGSHFVGAGKVGIPLDAEVEIIRETGRLLFLRGLVKQQGETVCAFTGTIRKTPAPRSPKA